LLCSGKKLRGTQRYRYRPASDGFSVYFHATGQLFQELRFVAAEDGSLKASAEHVCAADLYRSQYELGSDGCFVVRHVVQGPRKAYETCTVYRRADQAGGEAFGRMC
jgi:hypothetical protein